MFIGRVMRRFSHFFGYFLITLLILYPVMSLCVCNVPTAHADAVDLVFEFSKVVKVEGDVRDFAVAFHIINFLAVDANLIAEIQFGTSKANDLQGEGWYSNEE